MIVFCLILDRVLGGYLFCFLSVFYIVDMGGVLLLYRFFFLVTTLSLPFVFVLLFFFCSFCLNVADGIIFDSDCNLLIYDHITTSTTVTTLYQKIVGFLQSQLCWALILVPRSLVQGHYRCNQFNFQRQSSDSQGTRNR